MTYSLGARSLANLAHVHPKLVAVIQRAITLSAQDFGIPEHATRTPEEQAQKVAQGLSKTLHSRHLIHSDGYGYAVDLVPWISGKFTWDHDAPFAVIAKAMADAALWLGEQITWGGNWDASLHDLDCTSSTTLLAAANKYAADFRAAHGRPALRDLPHFQLEL